MDFSNMLQYLQGLLTGKQSFNQNAFGQEVGLAQTQLGQQGQAQQAAEQLAQQQLAAQIAQQNAANKLAQQQFGLEQTGQGQQYQLASGKQTADIAAQQAAQQLAQQQFGLQQQGQQFGQDQTKLQESLPFLTMMKQLGLIGGGSSGASNGSTYNGLNLGPNTVKAFRGGGSTISAPMIVAPQTAPIARETLGLP